MPPPRLPLLLVLVLVLASSWPARAEAPPEFSAWLAQLRQEAVARGVSREILDAALAGLQPHPHVVAQDRNQAETVESFGDYLARRVTPEQVKQGRRLLRQHRHLLAGIQRRHGVAPQVLVALWGLETQYGRNLGGEPVPAALATLAYDGRRGDFFRAQLLDALDILQAGHIAPGEMTGSWAGAMGQLQFMPSTFQASAVDGDGDGRKDIWHSLPDAFASGANYLRQSGWHRGERWGRPVRLPRGFAPALADPDLKKTARAWRALGVRQADGRRLPDSPMKAAILLPQGADGPAFLVYRNFAALRAWNRSNNYALAVGLLADRLISGER